MDRQTIDHIARLARLGVKDQDRSRYEGQLAAILQHFEQLRQSEASSPPGVEGGTKAPEPIGSASTGDGDGSGSSGPDAPTTSPSVGVSPGRVRPDEVTTDRDGAEIVALASDQEERSFRVPRVLE